ncbi:cell division protein FtsZ [Maribellus maritimus]|uniref:cell division protein FtsZ n=1 Tax=Maribellus maritimus TaxID=2870838 RepID=UPI001EE9C706|nr:cell division protein FtsZ [Maribellus maritimus]MCG6187908.1 cell division protein FtsZ [Maribellus maritimus]
MTEELVNFKLPKASSSIIKVIGVGGGGCNAVNHMFEEGITGVDYIICNTDSQALEQSPVPVKIQLGVTLTEGRGAGNKPEMGEEAARENYEDLKKVLEDNTKMLFITAGMGGGTGTGAAPVIAKLARELKILTIAVVTIPSPAEGKKRFGQAMKGIEKLGEFVDSMLVVSNQRLQNIFGDLPARQAFKMADNIVTTAVKGVAEIITVHGNVNIDYTDVHTVMHNSKVFIMGTGYATGEGRAMEAVNQALESPLLDSNDIHGTKNILLNIISGKEEIKMGEIGDIIETLQEKAGKEADIIWGNGYDESLGDKVSVTILATGFVTNPNQILQPKKEREKFDLVEDPEEEPVLNEQTKEKEEFVSQRKNENKIVFEQEENDDEKEEELKEKVYVRPKKETSEKSIFGRKKKKEPKRKVKKDEPVTEPSIDNWFYKNFGLGKLFDDEDQAMDE